jgi:CubicO group peptidase (beta-lactamase class C family)
VPLSLSGVRDRMPPVSEIGAVERLVDAFWARGGQPGLAYGVVEGGRLVHGGGRGVAALPRSGAPGAGRVPDADTVFRIASMTKSFTAAAVLLLRDEGALALDDEAVRYVPELAGVRAPTADAPAITVRSLLTMAAGFPTDDPWGDRQQGLPDDVFAELVAGGLRLAWTPGTSFEYSNLGYALLGRIVAAASGVPYAEFVTRRLLEPCGLASTCFEAGGVRTDRLAVGHVRSELGWRELPFDPHGAFAPMGGLFSSVRDLGRWVGEFTDAFPPRDDPEGTHPLRRASRREQQQPHRAYPPQVVWQSVDAPPVVRAASYGFGLVVDAHPRHGTLVGHSGGYPGFGSHMRWHPDSTLGVVVLANSTYAPAYVLAEQLLDVVLAARAAGVPAGRVVRGPAPAPRVPWPETEAAAAAVGRLLEAWDDDLAAGLFAENVDLDEPLAARRRRVEAIRELLGPLSPDPAAPVEHASPAHRSWWLRGPNGRLRVEIRLTPQRPPRVQTLALTPVLAPSPTLRRAVAMLRLSLNSSYPHVPELMALSPAVDRGALTRLLQAGAAWAGPVREAEVLAGDGELETSVRLAGARRDLVVGVRLALDGPPGPNGEPRVAGVTLRPFGEG